jgi:endonuclease/exonuclease/phosphatase family metal-dependent hydrolase
VELTFASYNIHKAVGIDRRRDPDRILSVLREIDADVIALQEADRRFGRRESVLPRRALDDSPWQAVHLAVRPESLGWHGNALLVRRGLKVEAASIVPLPVLEPRGAVRADISVEGRTVRVVGMHLDLSGIRRRHQIRAVLDHVRGCDGDPVPTVLMGDFNEWARHGGCFREFGAGWRVLSCGPSFPSRRPVAALDRLVVSAEWSVAENRVHHSALAATGSDHLPVVGKLSLPKN